MLGAAARPLCLLVVLGCSGGASKPEMGVDSAGEDSAGEDSAVVPDPVDMDGDGWAEAQDCDDGDAMVGAAVFAAGREGFWDVEGEAPNERPVLADLDGDGLLDMVVPEVGGLAVYRGDGEGAFVPLEGVALAGRVVAAAAADLDGDGDVDLGALGADGALLSFEGSGDGRFASAETVHETGCATPSDLQAGDLDGDGRGDLAAFCGDPLLITALSASDGAWTVEVTTPEHTAEHLRLGDLDADGDLDMVLAGARSFDVTALENDGLAGFTPHALALMEGSWALALLDADADGILDIVVGHDNDLNLVWFDHDGGWGFDRRVSSHATGLSGTTYELQPADLDGDGVQELVQARGLYTFAWSATEDGLTSLGESVWTIDLQHVAAGDLNDDGRADLVGTDGDGGVVARRGEGDGTFRKAVWLEIDDVVAMVAGDVDGDGLDDLVTCSDSGVFGLLRSTGSALVSAGETYTDASIGCDLALLDLDSDGDLDIVATSYQEELRVGWVEGAELVAGESVRLDDVRATDLFATSFDGGPDLVAAVKDGGDERLLALFGDGAGGLEPSESIDIEDSDGVVGAVDIDGDGALDLVRGGPVGTEIELWLGSGDGDLERVASLPTSGYLMESVAGDIDGDGGSELLFAAAPGAQIQRLSWDGVALSASVVFTPTATMSADRMALADLGGDGALDLVMGLGDPGPALLIGDGAGGFTDGGSLDADLAWGVSQFALLDVDGDGDQDVAVFGGNEGIDVFSNVCND